MRNAGYFRAPTVRNDTVVYVCEDDLWTVPLSGGLSRRLTAGLGAVARPVLSPDAATVAFTSQEEAHPEVYAMPAEGGQPRRLTYLGTGITEVVAWSPDGAIVFRTDAAKPFLGRRQDLWTIEPVGGEPADLGFGPAHDISFGPRGRIALGRHTLDPATWKRYRGGRVGQIWVDTGGKGTFRRILEDLGGNLTRPMWIGDRIWFVADHEGIGNIYSCAPDGSKLTRHTDHGEYYARETSTDGRTIVYRHAAELWALDVASGSSRRIDVDHPSPSTQRNRKFADAAGYLHSYAVHPDGHSIAIEARGKPFTMPLWDGAVREVGVRAGVRYREPQWLSDGERLVTISDEGGEEALEVWGADGERISRFDGLDLGFATFVLANPKRNVVAVANHRQELHVVDCDAGTARLVDRDRFGFFVDCAWSPDGAWLAYSAKQSERTRSIRLAEIDTGRTHTITRPEFTDWSPSFDPEGRYLYFVSARVFDPVYDAHFFEVAFPSGTRPYLVSLQADARNPFLPEPKGLGDAKKDDDKNGNEKKKKNKKDGDEPDPVRVELDGIELRVAAFPVPEKRYNQIVGIKGKALFTSFPIRGSLGAQGLDDGPGGSLEVYDFEQQKHEVLLGGVLEFGVARDGATLVYRDAGRRLRAIKAGDKPDAQYEKDPPGRRSGWIDLGRVRVSVEPAAEWRQMFREAWRLQRDRFWDPRMSGVDWQRVHDRYAPLVDKVATRLEFSDLMWELQGELGTSHAYEMGGDHRRPPQYTIGHLGVDVAWDARARGYRIDHVVRGDAWDEELTSPLARIGAGVREGQTLLAINGRRVSPAEPPAALLVNQAGALVDVTVGDARGKNPRTVTVRTLRAEFPARYKEWVDANRARVHEATKGRVGYVHIKDMGAAGYADFHRYWFSELDRDGLIVDVRYNGGGHVSSLILEKLSRRRIGYAVKRWGVAEPYPEDSTLGPMVCITNENAGSDGDIFTHCFKLMELGPVVGRRTWGGVVGIWVRHVLADNGVVTQPEFSFWFEDVGWGVENYGTDPDHAVDIAPQDYAAGRDPQMEKALSLIQAELKRTAPKLPDFSKRPSLKLPKLPKR